MVWWHMHDSGCACGVHHWPGWATTHVACACQRSGFVEQVFCLPVCWFVSLVSVER